MPSSAPLLALRRLADEATERAHVPYSGRAEAAALLLADGAWVPGVRAESATFSLVIPPLLNAYTTAASAGRSDVVAIALSTAAGPETAAYLSALADGAFTQQDAHTFVHADAQPLPVPSHRLEVTLEAPTPDDAAAGIALAREIAKRAVVPESHFPVGCVLTTAAGLLVPGVNVEHTDWSRILCAERNALGTLVSYGYRPGPAMYLSCPLDAQGTPCGACRQLLAELAPGIRLSMDRGDAPPEGSRPERLLPGAFTGATLAPGRS